MTDCVGPAQKRRKEIHGSPRHPRDQSPENEDAVHFPRFTLEELYAPMMVDITSPSQSLLCVREDLLISESAFFREELARDAPLWNGRKDFQLDDEADEVLLRCFVNYCRTGNLVSNIYTLEDATTWSWLQLTQLYFFGSKISAPGFRQRVFETCQLKGLQRAPIIYSFPCTESIELLWSQPDSEAVHPLRRFLVELSSTPIRGRKPPKLSEYHADFRRQCLDFEKRRLCARMCDECGICEDGKCFASGGGKEHRVEDGYHLFEKGWCFFHEHGERLEAQGCYWRMVSSRWRLEGTRGRQQ